MNFKTQHFDRFLDSDLCLSLIYNKRIQNFDNTRLFLKYIS